MNRINYSKLPFSARGGAKESKSKNKNLLALQGFFKKIVDTSAENCPIIIRQIEKKLRTTRRARAPLKISAIVKAMEENKKTDSVALVVAKVLDDETILQFPAMKIVALQWSKSVQKKIEANGGQISTLDTFMNVSGSLDNLFLISGDANKRKSAKYWGPAPGEKNSSAYPRCNTKSKNKERRLNAKKPISFD